MLYSLGELNTKVDHVGIFVLFITIVYSTSMIIFDWMKDLYKETRNKSKQKKENKPE